MKEVKFCIILVLTSIISFSQNVGINSTGADPDASALLDIGGDAGGDTKGLLIPRMSTVQRNAISSAAHSLFIFNTTSNCFETYNSTLTLWNTVFCLTGCSTPTAPVAVAASNIQQTAFDANWNVSSGAATYYLDVDDNSDFSSPLSGYNNLNVGNVVTHTISGLTCGTTYYYRIRANNDCGTSTSSNSISTTPPCFTCGVTTVNDVEGNTYNTVSIGTQCWLKENMRTTKYPDNSPITKGPSAHGDPGWTTDQSYYSCPPNTSNNGEDCAAASSLGMLYQWSAAMNGSTSSGAQGICPTGWHIPTDAEFCTLENTIEPGTDPGCNINGWRIVTTGSKMANDVAAQSWNSGNLRSDPGFGSSGFDLGPTGSRQSSNGNYINRGANPILWSSDQSGSDAWRRELNPTQTWVFRGTITKAFATGVRCIKD